MLYSKRICTVSVSNKLKLFRKFFQMFKCHTHCHYAGTNTPVIRDLITNDGTSGCIHNEPDISFDTTDFDIGFVSSKYSSGIVVIVVDKRFYTDSSGFEVVCNLLM